MVDDPCPMLKHFHTILGPMDAQDLFHFFFFRLTVIPGPPLFSLTVQLLDPFPWRVECIKDVQ